MRIGLKNKKERQCHGFCAMMLPLFQIASGNREETMEKLYVVISWIQQKKKSPKDFSFFNSERGIRTLDTTGMNRML